MINNKQVSQYLQQLQAEYPQAFKRNYVFYSQIKTKGIMDELKESIPWLIAAMIFVSITLCLGFYLESHFTQWPEFYSKGIAVLTVMLFFMFIVPVIIKQIKHSSTHLYEQLKNNPLKIAVLILLQSANIAYLQSMFLQGILFFLALSFGFVKFYKENMFRNDTKNSDYDHLQQIRRVCLWSYKQAIKAKLQMKLASKNSNQYTQAEQQFTHFLELHLQLLKYENEMCRTYKFIDLDAYMDSMM